MKEYVLGFLFHKKSIVELEVVLIEKQKPEWQKNFLNGVGGKIELDETPLQAMIREFKEEAGQDITDWKHFATMGESDKWIVYCYKAFTDKLDVSTQTDEKIIVVDINDLFKYKIHYNVSWLTGMALDADDFFVRIGYREKAPE